jgi:hypothetical protein
MKLKIVFLSLIAIIIQQNMLAINNSVNENFSMKMNQIFVSLDSVISNSKNKNQTVEQHFKFVKDKIIKGDLVVGFDSTLEYDFFNCSSFNVSKDSNPKVDMTFGKFVIDKYAKYPNLVYAIVIHTFQYAYDYYNNQSLFLIGTENPIENVYFKIDAIAIESLFLKSYVSDNNSLGPLENYLIEDLNNGLLSSPTLFMKTDIKLLHLMDDLKSKKGKGKSLLNDFNKIGKDLIENSTFENKSDWDNYCTLVSLKTYVFYSKQVIFDIVCAKEGVSREAFDLKRYSENMLTIEKIQQLIGLNVKYFGLYDRVMNSYGDKYKK